MNGSSQINMEHEKKGRASFSLATPFLKGETMTEIQKIRALPKSSVIRELRDFDGKFITVICKPHNGDFEDMLESTKDIEKEMHYIYEASHVNSRILATDESGKPKWAISPNLLHIAEIGTDEAQYIWGDITKR